MYQELVNKCKQAYKEKNMLIASTLWKELYSLLYSKLDNATDENARIELFREYDKYMEQFTNDEVYDITDYLKEQYYYEEEKNKNKKLVDITNDKNMEILDDFCNMYEWGIRQDIDNKYYIYDLQCSCAVDDGEKYDIRHLINRIVGRAIDYFRDEGEWENDNETYEYGKKLFDIATTYKKENKWEESWLNAFENELKSLKEEISVSCE